MTCLIHTFAPFKDESAHGYLQRLAESNRMGSCADLVALCGLRLTRRSLWEKKRDIASTLELQPEWLDEVLPPAQEGRGLHAKNLRSPEQDAVCADCLTEEPYLRQAWSHAYITACPKHCRHLVDTCPACSQPLAWERASLTHCDCGFDLRHAPISKASSLHVWVSARLQRDTRAIDGLPAVTNVEDCDKLLPVLVLLASRADPTRNLRTARVPRPRSVLEAIEFFAPLQTIFGAWPRSMHEHVALRVKHGPKEQYTLSGRLGMWFRTLARHCGNSVLDDIWMPVSDGIALAFDGKMKGAGGLRMSPGFARQYVSLNEAARRLEVSRILLTNAVDRGWITATVDPNSGGYRNMQLSAPEIERIKAERDRWGPLSQACEELGLPESVLKALIEVGAINVDVDYRGKVTRRGPVDLHDARSLAARLLCAKRTSVDGPHIALRELTARRTNEQQAQAALLRAIVSGKVHPCAHDGRCGIGGLMFPREAVTATLGSAALSDSLTLVQIERVTGWKYESLQHWSNTGLLTSETTALRGQTSRTVTVESLVDFMRTHVPVADLARHLGTQASAMTRKLKLLGVRIDGAKELGSGVHRGGLVRLEDLARLLAAVVVPHNGGKDSPEDLVWQVDTSRQATVDLSVAPNGN